MQTNPEQLSKLERDIVKAIVGSLGGDFHKAIVVSKIAASIALDLALEAYDQGRIDQCNYECGRGNGTFKQFIQDY